MLKILYQGANEENRNVIRENKPLVLYEFEAIQGGLKVKCTFSPKYRVEDEEEGEKVTKIREGAEKSFNILFDEWKGKIIEVRASNDFDNYTLFFADRFDVARELEFCSLVTRSEWYFPVMIFAVDENADEITLLLRCWTYPPKCPEGIELKDIGTEHISHITRLVEHSNFCKEKISRYRVKNETVVRWVDVYDTVSYLEAQVDALTRLVLKLTNQQGDEIAILKEADKYSVLDIKPIENIVHEFKEDKANARTKQTAFYTTSG